MRRFIAQRQSGTKGPKEPHKTTATTTRAQLKNSRNRKQNGI